MAFYYDYYHPKNSGSIYVDESMLPTDLVTLSSSSWLKSFAATILNSQMEKHIIGNMRRFTGLRGSITHSQGRRRHGGSGGSCPRCPDGAGAARGQEVPFSNKPFSYILYICNF